MIENQLNTGIIILAAGASSRLGRPKQLVKINEEFLLKKTVKTALESPFRPVVVVLGAYFEKIKICIDKLPVKIMENKLWKTGMGSSISCGINYLENNFPQSEGAYILLSDQPFLTTDILMKIKTEADKRNAEIVASKYKGTSGPPVFFSKNIFSELKKLNGQQGAKNIFSKYNNELISVDFPDGQYDIDTPDDVIRTINLLNKKSE